MVTNLSQTQLCVNTTDPGSAGLCWTEMAAKITSNVGEKNATKQKLCTSPVLTGSKPQICTLPCGQINDNEDPEKQLYAERRVRHRCRGYICRSHHHHLPFLYSADGRVRLFAGFSLSALHYARQRQRVRES